MVKKIFTVFFILLILITIGVVGLIANIVLEQYDATKQWQNTIFSSNMSEIPPELARNYVSDYDNETAIIWGTVVTILDEIKEQKAISDDRFDEYNNIYTESIKRQAEYEIISGQVADNNNQLSLYLDIFTVTNTAYTNPETEQLSLVTNRLYQFMFENDADVNQTFLDQLQTINNDYANLTAFINETIPRLGTIDNQILYVSMDMTIKLANEIVTEIDEHNLFKFPLIQRLRGLLTNDDWSIIINRHNIAKEYAIWETTRTILEQLSHTDYYEVSSITTYEDAIAYNMEIDVVKRKGYTIDLRSKVISLSYAGKVLRNNQYIRHGTKITAKIKPKYIKDPEPETQAPTETPNTETSTETSETETLTTETPATEKPPKKPKPSKKPKPEVTESESESESESEPESEITETPVTEQPQVISEEIMNETAKSDSN